MLITRRIMLSSERRTSTTKELGHSTLFVNMQNMFALRALLTCFFFSLHIFFLFMSLLAQGKGISSFILIMGNDTFSPIIHLHYTIFQCTYAYSNKFEYVNCVRSEHRMKRMYAVAGSQPVTQSLQLEPKAIGG